MALLALAVTIVGLPSVTGSAVKERDSDSPGVGGFGIGGVGIGVGVLTG